MSALYCKWFIFGSYGINISIKVLSTAIGGLVAAVILVPVLYPLRLISVNDVRTNNFFILFDSIKKIYSAIKFGHDSIENGDSIED